MPALIKQTRQYTRGLQKLFSRVYGSTLNDNSALPAGVTAGDALPHEDYIDFLEDDICMALVTTTLDLENPEPHVYEVNFHDHEFLSDIVGSVNPNPVWLKDLVTSEVTYSNITKHSAPLLNKKIVWTNPVGGAPASPNDNYKEVMFDCDDVVFDDVPADAPKSEAVILYKRVLLDDQGDPTDPANIDLNKSSLIAFFGGDSVALDPNGSDVNLVISGNGLIRLGVGYAAP